MQTQVRLFERIENEGYEQVVFCHDRKVGLKAIVSIHDSTLGPGTGGCRLYPYTDETAAVEDVLRLSKGMTYKAAISGLKLGGAKAVIIADPKTQKTPELLHRFGEFVESLGGRYITAKDVGITGADLMQVRERTRHILGIEGLPGSSGDPSPLTAWGVYNGMKAAARHVWGDASLKGKRIAVQGLGYVSYSLVKYLVEEGAQVVGADVDAAARSQREFGIEIVKPEEILAQACDILSPNALGSIINATTIPAIKAKIVAGAANNQLATDADGFELMRRGIVYAPDYAINAGGLINIYHEREGYDAARAYDHVAGIYRTIEEVLARADKENMPPHRIADRIAEERGCRSATTSC
ncbi:MAG: Glu/Leu/Phe/Val dehydrogenase [Deltaproteobacteria bacterium]|nr:Glu/Leu/Phe/Val dehydrogenase [Deltaproteobacteria bacterium]